jgi:hypothetical protein
MAERKQLWHPDDVKKKIQTSQLINRLTEHALSAEPIMDASQVNAAKILIGKVLPDVKAVELSGPNGGAIEVVTKEQRDAAVSAAIRADS